VFKLWSEVDNFNHGATLTQLGFDHFNVSEWVIVVLTQQFFSYIMAGTS
jgi:hypothetical protein